MTSPFKSRKSQSSCPSLTGKASLLQLVKSARKMLRRDEGTQVVIDARDLVGLFDELGATKRLNQKLTEQLRWTPSREADPPADPKEPVRSRSVLVTYKHPQFGWINDVDRLHLGKHRYWFHGVSWTHWRLAPLSPEDDICAIEEGDSLYSIDFSREYTAYQNEGMVFEPFLRAVESHLDMLWIELDRDGRHSDSSVVGALSMEVDELAVEIGTQTPTLEQLDLFDDILERLYDWADVPATGDCAGVTLTGRRLLCRVRAFESSGESISQALAREAAAA